MSKRGYAILPQGGDWGISFNAIPVLNYVGNTFNNTAGNTVSAAFPAVGAVSARKFIDDNNAYRALVRFDLGTTSMKNNTASDASGAPAGTTVEDKESIKNSNIQIGGGIEKRKGTSRVQGIYGAMAMIGKTGGSKKYTYGNAFSSTNTAPTTNNFDGNDLGGARITETKTGSGFSIGVVGFIGAEYFVAPKLSLGAEFQWGPSFQSNGKLDTTVESWDGVNNVVKTTTTSVAGGSSLGFNTAVTSINLNFFF
ncbi:MAG: hypothetical protein ACJ75J_12145 [Cytophagaceae bacterium]